MKPIEAIHAERSGIIAQKQELMSELQGVKHRLRDPLPHPEFARYEARRVDLVRQIQILDGTLSVLNSKKFSAAEAETECKVPHIKRLVELRDKYQAFAADGSRVASMRRMASEFCVELTPIIRQMMQKTEAE